MESSDTDGRHRIQVQLAAMDSLEVAFLYVDAQGRPAFLSSRAAEILFIKDRADLEGYASTLEPLLRLAQAHSEPSARRVPDINEQRRFIELELRTADDRPVLALAYARNFLVPLQGKTLEQNSGTAVILFDLRPLEPFFHTFDESRRARALLAMAAASLGRPLSLTPTETAFDGLAFPKPPSADIDSPSLLAKSATTADLADSLSTAVDIIDPLISKTHRVSVESVTPVLLAMPRSHLLRIISLLLLEAVDFAGPFGRTRVKAFVERQSVRHTGGLTAQIVIVASRQNQFSSAGPLENFLYRRYLPTEYRVTVGDRFATASNADFSCEEAVQRFIQQTAERDGVEVNPAAVVSSSVSVSEESYSETMRLALNSVRRAIQLGEKQSGNHSEVRLALKLPHAKMLAITFQMPLA